MVETFIDISYTTRYTNKCIPCVYCVRWDRYTLSECYLISFFICIFYLHIVIVNINYTVNKHICQSLFYILLHNSTKCKKNISTKLGEIGKIYRVSTFFYIALFCIFRLTNLSISWLIFIVSGALIPYLSIAIYSSSFILSMSLVAT